MTKLIITHQNKSVDLVRIWRQVEIWGRGNKGQNQLAHLAILVLSIMPNSASCERLFSEMGIIHTKLRN